eukprot:GHVP01012585.1.p1 GENE.GHVP01012585.1~~GHVP01012585.1.p1  ORF type:complete len:1295 (-),score=246.50 GHVP01012585.1:6051-9935(-)
MLKNQTGISVNDLPYEPQEPAEKHSAFSLLSAKPKRKPPADTKHIESAARIIGSRIESLDFSLDPVNFIPNPTEEIRTGRQFWECSERYFFPVDERWKNLLDFSNERESQELKNTIEIEVSRWVSDAKKKGCSEEELSKINSFYTIGEELREKILELEAENMPKSNVLDTSCMPTKELDEKVKIELKNQEESAKKELAVEGASTVMNRVECEYKSTLEELRRVAQDSRVIRKSIQSSIGEAIVAENRRKWNLMYSRLSFLQRVRESFAHLARRHLIDSIEEVVAKHPEHDEYLVTLDDCEGLRAAWIPTRNLFELMKDRLPTTESSFDLCLPENRKYRMDSQLRKDKISPKENTKSEEDLKPDRDSTDSTPSDATNLDNHSTPTDHSLQQSPVELDEGYSKSFKRSLFAKRVRKPKLPPRVATPVPPTGLDTFEEVLGSTKKIGPFCHYCRRHFSNVPGQKLSSCPPRRPCSSKKKLTPVISWAQFRDGKTEDDFSLAVGLRDLDLAMSKVTRARTPGATPSTILPMPIDLIPGIAPNTNPLHECFVGYDMLPEIDISDQFGSLDSALSEKNQNLSFPRSPNKTPISKKKSSPKMRKPLKLKLTMSSEGDRAIPLYEVKSHANPYPVANDILLNETSSPDISNQPEYEATSPSFVETSVSPDNESSSLFEEQLDPEIAEMDHPDDHPENNALYGDGDANHSSDDNCHGDQVMDDTEDLNKTPISPSQFDIEELNVFNHEHEEDPLHTKPIETRSAEAGSVVRSKPKKALKSPEEDYSPSRRKKGEFSNQCISGESEKHKHMTRLSCPIISEQLLPSPLSKPSSQCSPVKKSPTGTLAKESKISCVPVTKTNADNKTVEETPAVPSLLVPFKTVPWFDSKLKGSKQIPLFLFDIPYWWRRVLPNSVFPDGIRRLHAAEIVQFTSTAPSYPAPCSRGYCADCLIHAFLHSIRTCNGPAGSPLFTCPKCMRNIRGAICSCDRCARRDRMKKLKEWYKELGGDPRLLSLVPSPGREISWESFLKTSYSEISALANTSIRQKVSIGFEEILSVRLTIARHIENQRRRRIRLDLQSMTQNEKNRPQETRSSRNRKSHFFKSKIRSRSKPAEIIGAPKAKATKPTVASTNPTEDPSIHISHRMPPKKSLSSSRNPIESPSNKSEETKSQLSQSTERKRTTEIPSGFPKRHKIIQGPPFQWDSLPLRPQPQSQWSSPTPLGQSPIPNFNNPYAPGVYQTFIPMRPMGWLPPQRFQFQPRGGWFCPPPDNAYNLPLFHPYQNVQGMPFGQPMIPRSNTNKPDS